MKEAARQASKPLALADQPAEVPMPSQFMDLDRRTVLCFVRAGAFPERVQRRSSASLLDAHRPYMAARATEGCRDATQIWHELRARGFTGGHSIVRTVFAHLRGTRPDSSGEAKCAERSWFREHVVAALSTRRVYVAAGLVGIAFKIHVWAVHTLCTNSSGEGSLTLGFTAHVGADKPCS